MELILIQVSVTVALLLGHFMAVVCDRRLSPPSEPRFVLTEVVRRGIPSLSWQEAR